MHGSSNYLPERSSAAAAAAAVQKKPSLLSQHLSTGNNKTLRNR
jgi:hypothetical protein